MGWGINWRSRMFRSIKTKITVMVFVILLAMFTVQIACNMLFAEDFYLNTKSKTISKAFKELNRVKQKNDKKLVDIINEYEDSYNLQFIMANSNLVCIYNSKQYSFSNKSNKYKIRPGFGFKKNISLFSRNAKPVVKAINSSNEKLVLYGIIERGNEDYYIVIQNHIKSIEQDMKETNQLIFYISLIALCVGGIAAYIFAKKTATPIQEIEQVARNVAKLDFSLKANENLPHDEIGQLASSINTMSDELESSIKGLVEENQYKARIDQMRKEFIANVSHELKTPLAILTGYAELLNNNIQGIDKEFYYSVILDETSKMSNLVNHLLNLSKIENGLENLHLETTNISETISRLIDKNQILFQHKDLTCVYRGQENCYAKADSIYLELAVSNYISNAISHTKEGGNIEVSVKKTEDKENIRISVWNQGAPIAQEDIEQIWDSFYRGDKSRTRTTETHIGLGLYIVKNIISEHQGKYGVTNKDNGVEFFIQLNCREGM